MTINDFIEDRFNGWGIKLSQSDILSMGFDADEEFSTDKLDLINIRIVQFIPFLLLTPDKIKESELSISWDKGAIINFYKLMTRRYGLKDELGLTPTIEFIDI